MKVEFGASVTFINDNWLFPHPLWLLFLVYTPHRCQMVSCILKNAIPSIRPSHVISAEHVFGYNFTIFKILIQIIVVFLYR